MVLFQQRSWRVRGLVLALGILILVGAGLVRSDRSTPPAAPWPPTPAAPTTGWVDGTIHPVHTVRFATLSNDHFALSGDGTTLVVSGSRTSERWDFRTPRRLGVMPDGPVDGSRLRAASGLSVSHDGHLVAGSLATLAAEPQEIAIWREAGFPLLRLPGWRAAIHPAGDSVAVANTPDLTLYALPAGTPTRHWTANAIAWMAWNPSGQWLATLDGRCLLQVWDPAAAAPLLELALDCPRVAHPTDLAVMAAWNAAGDRLAISTPDHMVTIVAVPSGVVIGRDKQSDTSISMAWSPDGTVLATGTSHVLDVWSLADQRHHIELITRLRWLAFTPDGHDLVTIEGEPYERTLTVWRP